MADSITAYSFSEMLQDMYAKLGVLRETVATGGSTTTAVDSKLGDLGEDDDWKDGTLFVVRDSGGAAAAPEGEFERISGYTNASGTFTFAALSVAVASGDTIAYTDDQVPLYQAKRLANEGLQRIGDVDLADTTTLDSASDQKEYTMSLPWKRRPKKIEIQTTTGDANRNDWKILTDWDFSPAASGSTGLIIFKLQPTAERDLKIWYEGRHKRLVEFSDPVNEAINPELASHAGYLMMLRWLNNQRRGEDQYLVEQLNSAEVEFDRLRSEFPIFRIARQSRLNVVG